MKQRMTALPLADCLGLFALLSGVPEAIPGVEERPGSGRRRIVASDEIGKGPAVGKTVSKIVCSDDLARRP